MLGVVKLTYLSTEWWEFLTDKRKRLVVNNMPVKYVELAVGHCILYNMNGSNKYSLHVNLF